MTSAQVQKIFLPFEQVGDAKKQSEGTGLGLAISQKIVALMGSSLEVQSKFDQGSCFWFEVDLPEAQNWAAASRMAQQGTIVGYQGAKRKVLVVDDRWENRSVLVSLLEPIGFEVIEANNGQEGLDTAVATHPYFIITDLVMPVMDGFEMLRHLRQLTQFRDTAVIASSASVFEADEFKSVAAGANEFLPKPIETELLLQWIQRYLELEWIYEQQPDTTPATPTELNAVTHLPSLSDLQHLYQLLEMGDLDGMIEAAQQLKLTDSQLVPFAQKVIDLAEDCEMNELTAFLKQSMPAA